MESDGCIFWRYSSSVEPQTQLGGDRGDAAAAGPSFSQVVVTAEDGGVLAWFCFVLMYV